MYTANGRSGKLEMKTEKRRIEKKQVGIVRFSDKQIMARQTVVHGKKGSDEKTFLD